MSGLTHMSDEDLMKRYCEGDQNAFHEIYKRYSAKVYSFIKKRIRDNEKCDEIFQNVFEKFHKTRENFNPKYQLSQWVFVMTRSCLIDEVRKNKVSLVEYTDSHAAPDNEDPVTIDPDMLKKLNPAQEQVVKLRVIDDLSYEEISHKINKSQASIRKIFSRAMEKLKNG